MRQTPNLRRNAWERPQSEQRDFWRVLNFGFIFDLAIQLVLPTSAVLFDLGPG